MRRSPIRAGSLSRFIVSQATGQGDAEANHKRRRRRMPRRRKARRPPATLPTPTVKMRFLATRALWVEHDFDSNLTCILDHVQIPEQERRDGDPDRGRGQSVHGPVQLHVSFIEPQGEHLVGVGTSKVCQAAWKWTASDDVRMPKKLAGVVDDSHYRLYPHASVQDGWALPQVEPNDRARPHPRRMNGQRPTTTMRAAPNRQRFQRGPLLAAA